VAGIRTMPLGNLREGEAEESVKGAARAVVLA
jgi:hypothetical protein